MGTFFHPLTLIGPAGAQEAMDALVDTGSLFTVVPRPLLDRLGIRPFGTQQVRFANGQEETWEMGQVEAELLGRRLPILCLFGRPDVSPLLGALALESFVLTVDPVDKRLVSKGPAFLM